MKFNPEYIMTYSYDLFEFNEAKFLKKDLQGVVYLKDTNDCKRLLRELTQMYYHTIQIDDNTFEVNIRNIEIFRTKNSVQKKTIVKWGNE